MAKEKAEIVNDGRDPIAERQERRARAITFEDAGAKCHDDIKSVWKSEKHRDQWLRSLTDHTKKLSKKIVSEITAHDVAEILRPLSSEQADLALRYH